MSVLEFDATAFGEMVSRIEQIKGEIDVSRLEEVTAQGSSTSHALDEMISVYGELNSHLATYLNSYEGMIASLRSAEKNMLVADSTAAQVMTT